MKGKGGARSPHGQSALGVSQSQHSLSAMAIALSATFKTSSVIIFSHSLYFENLESIQMCKQKYYL